MKKSLKLTIFVCLMVMLFGGIGTIITTSFLNNASAEMPDSYSDYAKELSSLMDVSLTKVESIDIQKPVDENIENNGFILLENFGKNSTNDVKEYARFTIQGINDNYLTTLEVNVYHNGRLLSIGDSLKYNEDVDLVTNNITDLYLEFYVTDDASKLKYNNSDESPEDVQGLYEFYFRVRINGESRYPTQVTWYRYAFYLLNGENYGVDTEADGVISQQFPNIKNVEVGEVGIEENYAKVKGFNFNGIKSTYVATKNDNVFPVLSFDPERYSVSIKHNYNGINTYVDTTFNYTDSEHNVISEISNYGTLSFKERGTDKVVSFYLVRNNLATNQNFYFSEDNFTYNQSNTINYIEPLIKDLGTYEFTYKYTIFINGEFLSEPDTSSNIAIGVEKLSVFGVESNYALNESDSAVFNNYIDGVYSDITGEITGSVDIVSLARQVNQLSLDKIVSTNQAPVWFNVLGELDLANCKYTYITDKGVLNFSESGADWLSYSKNQYFQEAGYYLVKLAYKYNEFNNADTYNQIFLFKLTNRTPEVQILTESEDDDFDKVLNSSGFTNKDVIIKANRPGYFDSDLRCYYSVNTSFGENNENYQEFEPYYDGEDDYKVFTEQGKYYVKVYFTRYSYTLYSFVIDKTDLSGLINVRGVSQLNSSAASIQYRMNDRDLTGKNIVSETFTIYINEKESKSPITGYLTTYDIIYKENTSQTELYSSLDESIKCVHTDYIATNASSKQSYNNVRSVNNTTLIVSSQYVFSTQKIYIFEFSDASGYSYTYVVYLDNTKVNIIQKDKNDIYQDVGDFNIVSEKTSMYWGTHKSVVFPTDYVASGNATAKHNSEVKQLLQNTLPEMFMTIEGNFMMVVPITKIEVSSKPLTTGATLDYDYSEYNNAQHFTIYPDLDEYSEITDIRIKGEKRYSIKLYDASEGRPTTYEIEMNMDRSVSKVFTTDDADNTIAYRNVNNRLTLEQAGSLQNLIFEWKDDDSGIYQIETIYYDFYPLVYDTTLSTYPFASTPLKSNIDIYSTRIADTTQSGMYYSTIINPTPRSIVQEDGSTETLLFTEQGKYVFTRIYKGDDNSQFEGTGDSKVRQYTFYCDYNPIVGTPDSSTSDELELGSAIKLHLGEEAVPFNEFYRETIYKFISLTYDPSSLKMVSEYINVGLITNLLPIKISVPKTKYSAIVGNVANSYSIPMTFNLVVTLDYYKDGARVTRTVYDTLENVKIVYNSRQVEISREYNIVDANGWISIDNITMEGVYKLAISDNALPPNNEISPSAASGDYFAFEVQHSAPESDFLTAKTPFEGYEETPLELSLDDEGNYLFTWVSSMLDLGIPTIDDENILVECRRKTGSGNFGDYFTYQTSLITNTYGNDTTKIQYTLKLPAYYVDGNITYACQYRITSMYRDDDNLMIQHTPIMDDYKLYSELPTSKSSTSSDVIVFAFEDPSDEFYARIDDEEIVVRRALKKADGTYGDYIELVQGVDFEIQSRWQTSNRKYYTIELEADNKGGVGNEYIYKIYYHYVGNRDFYVISSGNKLTDFYGSEVALTVDRTPPSYNLTIIANTTKNVKALQINNITEYYTNSHYMTEDGVYYYANTGNFDFAIDSDYEFTRPQVSSNLLSQNHEAQSIYFRKYYKYDTDNYTEDNKQRAYQALVPGNPDYYSGTSARLRFNVANYDEALPAYENWYEFGYDMGSFYDYLLTVPGLTDLGGYYEIVEVDEAGNYTIYTVLLSAKDPTLDVTVRTENGDEHKVVTVNDKSIDSLNYLALNGINSEDGWFTVSINNKTYNITPTTNVESILDEINALFIQNTNYKLIISNRFGNDLSVDIRIGSADTYLGIASVERIGETDTYKVVFDSDTDIIKLRQVIAYKFDDDKKFKQITDEDGNPTDSEGNIIIVDSQIQGNTRTYHFAKGIYRFLFEDNFRNGEDYYIVSINIGLSGNWEFTYTDYVYNGDNGIKYTSGSVVLDAPEDLYTITATMNNVKVDIDTFPYVFEPARSSNDSDIESGASNHYKVTIYNVITEESVVYEFVIYNIFPAIKATDSLGLSMNSVISTSRDTVSTFTSKAVYLEWDVSAYPFYYSFEIFRYADNSSVAIESSKVTHGTSVNKEGLYELRMHNVDLNSTRSIYFMIKDSLISMYQVYETLPDETVNMLLPSEELLNISEYESMIKDFIGTDRTVLYPYTDGKLMVKNYFSRYTFKLEIEGDKNLKSNFNDPEHTILFNYNNSDLDDKFITQIVVVYGVSPYSYIDVFALTKIQSNSRFLTSLGYVYESAEETKTVQISATDYDYVTVFDAPIKLFWQSYYGVQQNKIYLNFYHEGVFISSTYGNSDDGLTSYITLTVPGTYKFEFLDMAGNKQIFGSNYTNAFTIVLKSEVVYKINGDTPIYGAVYNKAVKLTIPNSSTYVNGTLGVQILRNGAVYEYTAKNYEIDIAEQGVYEVRINGSVNDGNVTKPLKESVLVFTIINSNEARFAYEFTNINGYEISKVIKNNVDITSRIKVDNVSLYSLLISEETYGVGRYHIYVVGSSNNILIKSQSFDFEVWVNNEIPVITSSIEYGETSTDDIILTYNSKSIYEQIGNCKIIVGSEQFEINENTIKDEITTLKITRAGTYYVTLETDAGNKVSMFKVIKKDPLNAVSIIIIIAAVILVTLGIILFFKLRVRMRIK